MELSLNSYDASDFYDQLFKKVKPKGSIYNSTARVPGVRISLRTFILIIEKFTLAKLHPVKLDIIYCKGSYVDSLFFSGIRDLGIRKGEAAEYLPLYQKGAWKYTDVKDAFTYGILPKQIDQFRKNLKLRHEDGITDDEFFR